MTFDLGCEGHMNIFQVGMRERAFQEGEQPEQRDQGRALHALWGGVYERLCAPGQALGTEEQGMVRGGFQEESREYKKFL